MQLSGTQVLLVDDDDDVRESVRDILRERGADVVEARDGREALFILRSGAAVELVVTDIVMPDIEGLTLIRAMRREFPRVRIVAVSGGGLIAGDEYLHAAHHFGADATLPKPFDPTELVRTVLALAPPAPLPPGPPPPRDVHP